MVLDGRIERFVEVGGVAPSHFPVRFSAAMLKVNTPVRMLGSGTG